MTLLKRESERVDKNGKPYIDLFFGWHNEKNELVVVRVKPCFLYDVRTLEKKAVFVPKGENLAKYVD